MIDLYLAAQTQWRVGPAGLPVGLDYAGVAALMQIRGQHDPDLFAHLQIAERAALAAYADISKRGPKHGR